MSADSATGRRPGRPKWLRRFAIALILYTIVGFGVLPPIIKSQMRKRLAALTHRECTIRQVRVNPFVFSLTIRGFSLKEPNGDVFSSFDEFYINFQPIASLFHWGLVFREISLKDPFGAVIYKEDGTFNFANLFENLPPPPPTPPKPSPPPKLLVYHLMVTNGALALADLTRKEPFRSEFGPINLDLTNLTTVRNKNSPYSFVALTDSGERFAWAGNVSVNPPSSAGTFELGGLKLGKYSTYSHDYARYEIAGGTVGVAADYRLDMSSGAPDLDVTNVSVQLADLSLKAPGTGEELISVPDLTITNCDASVLRRSAHVGLIHTSGGSLAVRREADGSINLLSLLNLPPSKPGAKSADDQPWTARIDEVAVEDYTLNVEDKVPEKPASIKVDQIALTLRNLSTVPETSLAASLSVRFQDTGHVGIVGTGTLIPPSAELKIGLTNLDLRAIQPYVHEQAKLAITSCALDLNGTARLAPERLGPPRATFAGNLVLNKLSTTDDVLFKDFTKWDALSMDGIKVELMPEKLHVDQIKYTGVSASLIIGPDRQPNIFTILRGHLRKAEAAATNAAALGTNAGTTPPIVLPEITIDNLLFENGSLHFQDESLQPHCNFDVAEFGGSIRGISSKAGTIANVDLKGKVDEHSPFSITGDINPLTKDQFANVTVSVTNTELTAFSPYSEKFAGHTLEKGKFSMAVHYHIENKALKAENSFYVDQLTLGPRNNSPDATSLPVKLAVALLKDRDGRIALDVPLTGRVDDPKFRVGPIIWQVVKNLLVKAATSPFALLGAAFGGGGEELSYVEFAPGHAELSDSETKKLDTLSKALFERPALNLEISGSANPETEREPLARLRFEEKIKAAYIQELTDDGKPAVTLAEVQLQPKERERLVRKVYKKEIGRYKPTEPPTNAVPDAAEIVPTTGPGTGSSSEPLRGAAQLYSKEKAPVVPERLLKAAAASGKSAKSLSRSEIELADMEDQLVARINITDDDLRDLMQQRAKLVESYLLKSGQIDNKRLFIIAPKPINDSFRGSNRVNLSLN